MHDLVSNIVRVLQPGESVVRGQVVVDKVHDRPRELDLFEERGLSIYVTYKTGKITHEVWSKDGILDRADGPAVIFRDPLTNVVTKEVWNKAGVTDRTGGPAFIIRNAKTGIVTHEEWWRNGERDRGDGPADVKRDAKTGRVISEEWWKDGLKIPHAPGSAP